MTAYIDGILREAIARGRLMVAADALCAEPSRGMRVLRLCLGAALIVLLAAFPAECGALLR